MMTKTKMMTATVMPMPMPMDAIPEDAMALDVMPIGVMPAAGDELQRTAFLRCRLADAVRLLQFAEEEIAEAGVPCPPACVRSEPMVGSAVDHAFSALRSARQWIRHLEILMAAVQSKTESRALCT